MANAQGASGKDWSLMSWAPCEATIRIAVYTQSMLPNSICAGALIAILAVISIDRNPEDESDASMKLTGMRSTPACRQGFTLLELLVVMVIIGLLAAYVGPRYFAQIGKSEQGAARAQIESFAKALDAYRLDIGRYPTTDQGLDALVVKPGDEPRWQGPYLQKAVPVDPWGRAYVYRAPVANGDFELMSFGKDGQPGGGGDNADVAYR